MRIEAAVMEKPDGTLTRRRIRIETVLLDDPRPEEVRVAEVNQAIDESDAGAVVKPIIRMP